MSRDSRPTANGVEQFAKYTYSYVLETKTVDISHDGVNAIERAYELLKAL